MKKLVAVLFLALLAAADPILTEIMYNPRSSEPSWEWVELYNASAAPLNLAGYILDDRGGADLGAANIAGGIIPAGGVAVLYNSAVSGPSFAAAWGAGVIVVGVKSWPTLNNGGDTIGLWSRIGSYLNDRPAFSAAVFSLAYDDSTPWPVDDGAASVYLKSVSLDPTDPANWALSMDGVAGAFQSAALGGNSGADIGSPGFVVGMGGAGAGPAATAGAGGSGEPVPEPGTLALLGAAWAAWAAHRGRRRRHRASKDQ